MPATVGTAIASIGPAIAGAGSAVAGAATAAAPFIKPATALINAGSSLINGMNSSDAAKNAAMAGQGAALNANAFNQQVYAAEQANMNPFILTGQSANNELGGLLGLNGNTNAQNAFDTFRKSSPYQFQLDQGMKAIEAQNAGQYGSGATAKALNNFAQGQASSSLGAYMAQLGNLNTSGQNAAGTLGGFGNFANQQNASNLYNGANAYGNGQYGQSTAQNAGLNGLTSALTSFLNPAQTPNSGYSVPSLNLGGGSGGGVLSNMPNFVSGTHDYSGTTIPGVSAAAPNL